MFKKHKLLSLGLIFLSLSLYSQKTYTFSGIVTDSISGRALEGVEVFVSDQSTGTLSGSSGEFMLYLEKGKYEICFCFDGYRTFTYALNLDQDVVEEITLGQSKKIGRPTLGWIRRPEDRDNLTALKGINKEAFQTRKSLQ